eukprot:CAMPEP_0114548746 /NCGR_PEP_ID=MMETSP0114-20121206/5153_1 /TAXON_ID=31324 /ORGANISM="Goniomonas sp, Strain m" /LENGTH=65 /DNA_ID=CAMNT_0001733371 /DNA_START=478 /DNA_END=675 /DNA_ORIENTATION=-
MSVRNAVSTARVDVTRALEATNHGVNQVLANQAPKSGLAHGLRHINTIIVGRVAHSAKGTLDCGI